MLKKNNLFYLFLLALLPVILFFATTSPEVHTSNQRQESHGQSFSIKKITVSLSPLVGLQLQKKEGKDPLFNILKSLQNVVILKVLSLFLGFFALFQGRTKERFIVYLTRLQYFIADLKIYILDSRAHPPTC